jgi:hypothetical protein
MRSTTQRNWLARIGGALLILGALLPLAAPGAALAHERRAVGPYTFIVGFISEPSLAGQPNGIDLRISNTADGSPVEGVDKTLKAAIAFGGGQPKDFPLRAVFGKPGAYTADLIPTKPGSYIFTFTGAINGTQVNEKFESGPGRFDDVQDAAKIQFPDTVPAPAQMATTVQTAQQQAQDAAARASAAEDQITQARTFGIAGIVIGLIGLGLAAWALASARRTNGAAPAAASTGPVAART